MQVAARRLAMFYRKHFSITLPAPLNIPLIQQRIIQEHLKLPPVFYVLTSVLCEIRDGFTNTKPRFKLPDIAAESILRKKIASQEKALAHTAAPIIWVLILVYGLDDKKRFDTDSAPFLANVPDSRDLLERLIQKRPGFSDWTWRFDLLLIYIQGRENID
jgi:hypothetical protein